MYKLLVLLAVVGCALSAALPEGLIRQPSGRIVGGIPTTIDRFPYQVSVQRNGAHSCGGVIYSTSIIITAAHCLQAITPSGLKIRAGSTYWNSGSTLVTVSNFLNHEDYNPNTLENDIAVIRLFYGLSLNSNIRSISLSTYTPSSNVKGLVSGWGSLYYNGPFQPQLLYANVIIVASETCSSGTYGYGKQVKSSMLCAIGEGMDSCQGDSGGPLVIDNNLAGIVSWGIGCGNRNYPGVYTNIAYHRSWILKTVPKL